MALLYARMILLRQKLYNSISKEYTNQSQAHPINRCHPVFRTYFHEFSIFSYILMEFLTGLKNYKEKSIKTYE